MVTCQNPNILLALSPDLFSIFSFNNNLEDLNQHMTRVETGLEGMKTEFSNIKNILDRIFVVVFSGQVNTNLTS